MASVDLNVQGDASGGVEAIEATKNALADLQGATGQANAGLAAASDAAEGGSAKIALFGEYTRGTTKLISGLGAAAQESGPALGLISEGAGEAAGGLANIAAAAVRGTASLGPWGGVAFGAIAAINELASSSSKVVAPMTAAEFAAQDAGKTFGGIGGSVGVSTSALIELAAAGLRVEGPVTEAGSVAEQAASQIFEIIGASDAAGTATAKLASQSDLLAASQDQMSSRLMASVGSFNAVAAAAQAAGMSVSEYQQIVGTQTAVPAPTELWQGPAARAGGGPVTAGAPYIVGENHPGGRGELFIPNQSGTILPAGSFDRASAAGQGAPWASTQVIFAPQFHMNAPAYGYDDLRRTVLGWVQDSIDQFNSFHGHIEGN